MVEINDVRKWQVGALVVAATSALACSSGDPVNIGENHQGKTGESLSDYGAFWDGYVEAVQFSSGSGRLRLQLDEEGHGYLELGDIPLLAPATDPDVPYAPEPFLGDSPNHYLQEGFRYTVLDTAVEAKRLRLSVAVNEIYGSWCELQTSYPRTDPSQELPFGCIPPSSTGGRRDGHCYVGNPDDPENRTEVGCTQFEYCTGAAERQICACTAGGCAARDNRTLTLDAALAANGTELTGTFVWNDTYTARLTRE
jgi:hypothetical protein